MQFTRAQAAAEIMRRRQLRGSLEQWSRLNGYIPAAHHRLLIAHLEKLLHGDLRRLAVFMPPGSAKSTYGSILFPSWILANNPKALILAASHTTELAERWGRRVRNLVQEHGAELNVELQADSLAAGRWATAAGGEYYAAGAGTGIAGFRGLYGLIDDPIRSRQDADSQLVRDRMWDWYLNDFRPRLIPEARQLLIQCLAGDTRIHMANGSVKRLDVIVPGDQIISWDGTKETSSKVNAVVDNGTDQIYLIRTIRTEIRANARHPFLVLSNGGLRWVRTRDLRHGMRIVAQRKVDTRELSAQATDVALLRNVEECVPTTTPRQNGLPDHVPLRLSGSVEWRYAVNGATALMQRILIACLQSRMDFAPYVRLMEAWEGPNIGSLTSYPIITTTQGSYAASYATIATGSQDEIAIPKSWSAPSNTSEVVTDIIESGRECVYDLAIDNTHNFIANGLWCHNTRWHEDDLAGRALNHQPWEVLSLPALAKSNDQLGRAAGEPLWNDDDYGYGAQLVELQATTPPRVWSALYQQEPTPDEGDFFKEEWLHPLDILPKPELMRTYGASDYAVTQDGGDYTVHAVFGVDHLNNLYLLEIWRDQTASDQWVEAFCDLVEDYRPLAWAEEQGQIKSGVGPFLERRMRERRVYVNREQFPTRGDKVVRCRSIQGRMALDGLYYPRNEPWVADWLAEILNFPASKHDDQADAMGLAGQLLDKMIAGRAGKPPILDLPRDGYGYRDPTELKLVDPMTL